MITFHRIEFWSTSEGMHIVATYEDGTVRQVGVLWI